MARKSITPKTDADLYSILSTMNEQIPGYKVALNITLAEETAIADYKALARWIIDFHEALTAEKEGLTKFKDKLLFGDHSQSLEPFVLVAAPAAPGALTPGIWEQTSKIITKIKDEDAYDDEIGETLGIVGPEIIKDFSTIQAELNLKFSTPQKNEFTFVKHGADGIKVLRCIVDPEQPEPPEGELVFETETIVTRSPYIDTTPNQKRRPENRGYKIWLWDEDKTVGLPSEILWVPTAIYYDQEGNEISGIPK